MIVDPATGLPVEEMGANAQSMAGQYGSTIGQSYGVEMPLYYDAMEAIPSAWSTVAWNMGRTRNTILNNKTASSSSRRPWNRGVNAGGLRQTFSPFRFGSLADLSNIDPDAFGTTRPSRGLPGMRGTKGQDGVRTRGGYTPFNFLTWAGNTAAASKWAGKYQVAQGARAFAPGAFGTMSTMASIASGSYNPARVDNVMAATNRFRQANAGLMPGISGPVLPVRNIPMPSIATSNLLGIDRQRYMSSSLGAARFSNVKYTGRAVGYFEGAQAARTGTMRATNYALLAADGGGYFGEGVASARSAFAEGSRLARFAGSRSAALGLKAVPYVGQAMIVHDVAKFFGKSVGRGLKLGVEGIKSAQGDLTKPGPFGMGYKDNSVAATSRQRGVMAISNSRLNARSFLGQEAAFVYQNFG